MNIKFRPILLTTYLNYLIKLSIKLSKLLMYGFFYNKLQPKWKDNELLYVDCDSNVFNIQTEYLYKDIEEDPILKDEFNFSEYSPDHKLYSTKIKK